MKVSLYLLLILLLSTSCSETKKSITIEEINQRSEIESYKEESSKPKYSIKELRQKLIGLTALDMIDELGKPDKKNWSANTFIRMTFLYLNKNVIERDGTRRDNIFIICNGPDGWGDNLSKQEVIEIRGTNYNTLQEALMHK